MVIGWVSGREESGEGGGERENVGDERRLSEARQGKLPGVGEGVAKETTKGRLRQQRHMP